MRQMIDKADLIVTAWDGDKLVGVSRSLTDFCYVCYLSDLAVDRAYQRKGIGKELVRLTQERIGDQTYLLLLAAPEAEGYYAKIGFEPLKPNRGWYIDRKG
jgi:ribosomal protein S18 acetylase RimI-like enzyme